MCTAPVLLFLAVLLSVNSLLLCTFAHLRPTVAAPVVEQLTGLYQSKTEDLFSTITHNAQEIHAQARTCVAQVQVA